MSVCVFIGSCVCNTVKRKTYNQGSLNPGLHSHRYWPDLVVLPKFYSTVSIVNTTYFFFHKFVYVQVINSALLSQDLLLFYSHFKEISLTFCGVDVLISLVFTSYIQIRSKRLY